MGEPSLARHIGQNLRRVRSRVGISQEEVGIRSGLHRTEIGLLERGERLPRIDTLLKLAGALSVKFEGPLLEGIEWQPGSLQRGAFSLAVDLGGED